MNALGFHFNSGPWWYWSFYLRNWKDPNLFFHLNDLYVLNGLYVNDITCGHQLVYMIQQFLFCYKGIYKCKLVNSPAVDSLCFYSPTTVYINHFEKSSNWSMLDKLQVYTRFVKKKKKPKKKTEFLIDHD